MDDANEPRTRDPLFLAITRMATVYGVPLGGFLLAVGGVAFVFDVTSQYSILWRVGLCGGALLLLLGGMRWLTSREPKWFAIFLAWSQTRLPVRFSKHTRAYGGTTFRGHRTIC
jgi:type IV secretory pathway VirB3-like protein